MAMYEHRRTRIPIRDAAPAYGEPDPDGFPGDAVLRDLPLAEGADASRRTARILARYAALRYWLLREEGAPVALTRHARSAARAHLGHLGRRTAHGVPAGWREGSLLRRVLDADLAEAASLLAAAAGEAAASGDPAGAAALAEAARRATLRRLDGGDLTT